ncbi:MULTISPECIES: DNA-processing protein DprA [Pseudidiomarina]|uniref:DNA recombination-mediator protein A n=2 Tax=Pseudidiomarina TaxID=2800384 RepID=A0A368UQZ3_9GAMM|nr:MULTISPECIES: DNA-processing protein DprA [Pseudidiomarina]PWW11202.1 DNA recombination-mediator protein A [Pseudidiomarina maritima]RBP88498.1 DNA recombination-mediator protein A [Pseudidiomarina tainanensis]RCW30450.1 DNA recombination-mediator protein A [Pseudidiomarina tainanensis]
MERRTQAILLISSLINSQEAKYVKPLTVNEYGYFVCWLAMNGFSEEDLLSSSSIDSMEMLWSSASSHYAAKKAVNFYRLDATIRNIQFERIRDLLKRESNLSNSLERWQRAGIWILDRHHEHYPSALAERMGHQSPALLFGIGNPELLNKQAIAFVGSRNRTLNDSEHTQHYVSQVNRLGFQVVSGGAAGIDIDAMTASLTNDNSCVGILADSLYKAASNPIWQQGLQSNKLALITPQYPESGFSTANAMIRNKYIYAMSCAAVVVCSGEKGGTWEGAQQNLKHGWAPLFVSKHEEPLQLGNSKLLAYNSKSKLQATPINAENFSELLMSKISIQLI